MHSAISCLQSILPGLKADEKLFLIFLLYSSEQTLAPGTFNLIDQNGAQLAKRFGFTKEASFRALSVLQDFGLIMEVTEQGKLGRPRKLRKVIGGSWESREANREIFRYRLATQTLNLVGHALKSREKRTVNNALLMLLAVLIIKADRTGAVTEASHGDLSDYSGVPKSQIPRRIGQLREIGVISAVVPGLVEGSILGKPNSIYYLNLNHQLLEGTGMKAEPIMIRGKGCSSPEIGQIVRGIGRPGVNDRLTNPTHHANSLPKTKMTRISPDSWEQNAPSALRRPAAKLYIQCAIERHAAKLLSDPNLILSEHEWRRAADYATSDFVRTLTGQPPRAVAETKEYSRMFYSLCADLEELSHQLARTCVRLGALPKRNDAPKAKTHTYRILPSGLDKRTEVRLERVSITG